MPDLRGIDLSVHAGEIVVVCGVAGNGQSELVEVIARFRPWIVMLTDDPRDI